MGDVVEWSRPAAVEYDDHAMDILTKLSAVALAAAAALMKGIEDAEWRKRGIDALDDISMHGDLINEHIGLIEANAEDIIKSLQEDAVFGRKRHKRFCRRPPSNVHGK